MNKRFIKTRVVTKDFMSDWFQNIRSLFGIRMKSYENNILKAYTEMMAEVYTESSKIVWYRMNQDVINDAIIITIYGEYEIR